MSDECLLTKRGTVLVLAGGAVLFILALAQPISRLAVFERRPWAVDACVVFTGVIMLLIPLRARKTHWRLIHGGAAANVFIWMGWVTYMVFALATLGKVLVRALS